MNLHFEMNTGSTFQGAVAAVVRGFLGALMGAARGIIFMLMFSILRI